MRASRLVCSVLSGTVLALLARQAQAGDVPPRPLMPPGMGMPPGMPPGMDMPPGIDRQPAPLPFHDPGGVQMAVSGGKLYVVAGRTLKRLDAYTLKEEASAQILQPPAADPSAGAQAGDGGRRQMAGRARTPFERFDANRDGVVTVDELPNPRMLERLDRNGDGRITPDEAPAPTPPQVPVGPVSLLVEGGNVYVSTGGWLYRFKADDLSLGAQVQLVPPPGMERPGREMVPPVGQTPGPPVGQPERDRPMGRDRPRGFLDGRRGMDRTPPPPAVPEEDGDEPVRF